MVEKNKSTRFSRFNNYELMGGYIKRYSVLYIVLLFLVAFFEVVLCVRELTLIRTIPLRHYLYIVCYIVLFLASMGSAIYILFARKKTDNEYNISIIIHIYALIALLWGASVSLLDYVGGDGFPAVFFTITATIGGLLVLNPFIYIPFTLFFDLSVVVGMYLLNPSLLNAGNIINIVILFIMIAVVSYRTSAVAVSEEDQRNFLMKISMIDSLTGLKNENAYYRFLDKLDKKSSDEKFEYAVIVMDVNGLKYVDDTYGHRFGAHLISKAGKFLPMVFKNCDIFHTGGDEFVCIITKEFANLDSYLEKFAEELEYMPLIFEGVELYLSLARGVAIHKPNEKYNDTYQRADRDMYENKPIIKEKYKINSREK